MFRLLFIFAFLFAAGCSAGPQYPLRSHELGVVDVRELPQGDSVSSEASTAKWKAPSSRLAIDLERAVKRADWGLLELSSLTQPSKDNLHLPLRVEVLLPDNRLAVIHAWAIGESEVAAAVMIGRFGDRKAQDYFLQMLADTLADKPKPRRGGTFELP